jgi:LysR family transcriptional regulator of gallate degradation
MNLRQLDYFLAVLRTGSFTAAAELLNVAQPTLTKSIHALEQELDSKLFERLPRGVAPTKAGEALHRHAERVSIQVKDAIEELRNLHGGTGGPVSIGAGPSWLRSHLPEAIASVVATNPGVKVSVLGGFDELVLKALRAGELDFVVAELPAEENARDLSMTPLSSDRLSVLCRKSHPLVQRKGQLTPGDLLAFPWIMPPKTTRAQQRLNALFVSMDMPVPNIVVETESVAFLLRFVTEFDALTFTVSSTINLPDAGACTLLRVPALAAERSAGVITRKDGWLAPAAELVIAALKARCAGHIRN